MLPCFMAAELPSYDHNDKHGHEAVHSTQVQPYATFVGETHTLV
jgi:hypothetical protein